MAKRKINAAMLLAAGEDAHLQTADVEHVQLSNLMDILVTDLYENPYQPRISIDEDDLKSLSNSIEKSGLLQPIVVTKRDEGGYIIVAGHRRVEAHRLLGLDNIKSIVKKVEHVQLAILPLVENLQRKNTSVIEDAIAFKRLLDDKIVKTQDELATLVSLTKSSISKTMSVLKLPEKVIKQVKKDKYRDVNVLSLLNKIPEEKILEVYSAINKETRSNALDYIKNILNKSQSNTTKDIIINTEKVYKINLNSIPKEHKKKIDDLVNKLTKDIINILD